MQDFEGKVAVVTGGAAGIGRGMAERLAAAGAKLVLADVNSDALAETAKELESGGASVLQVQTDVTDYAQVQALARRAFDEFGAVHVLCNNAGISTQNIAIWDIPIEEWRQVVGVNFWGVLHGIHAFVPLMLQSGAEGHIVNTASAAGLGSRPGLSPYVATKHAVVALTESLHHDLRLAGANVRASVLCPGRVVTRMSSRAPDEERSMLPSEVGDMVVAAIREQRFWILTHPEGIKERVRGRAEDLLQDRDPTHSLPIF
jgi:NAD(P)-dependent dehydrogenase (short-subunit alcohol dehydrogenase family)